MNEAPLTEIMVRSGDEMLRLNSELDRLEAYRHQIAQLQARIWSAGAGASPGMPEYGALRNPYTANVAGTSGTSPPAHGLEARLLELQLAEVGAATRVGQLAKAVRERGLETQQIRGKVDQGLRSLVTQALRLGGTEAKMAYCPGEGAYRRDLGKCDELLGRINSALRRAGSALSAGPSPCVVEGPISTATRSVADYVRDGLLDGTLYALSRPKHNESRECPERPAPQLGSAGEPRTGTLADKIAAGQGYLTPWVSDEYRIPMPSYYYRRYRDGYAQPSI